MQICTYVYFHTVDVVSLNCIQKMLFCQWHSLSFCSSLTPQTQCSLQLYPNIPRCLMTGGQHGCCKISFFSIFPLLSGHVQNLQQCNYCNLRISFVEKQKYLQECHCILEYTITIRPTPPPADMPFVHLHFRKLHVCICLMPVQSSY